ncbi:MAG: type II toxin-antitoxin system VapC family toxin [Pseudomonadota bacterium]
MRAVLLDTNAFAMVLTDDPRLPAGAKEAILDAPKASLSAITFYEIGQKVRLGKWDEMAPFAPRLVDIALEAGFDLVPLSADVATCASLLEWQHRDPFDRMIAAATLKEGLDLISSDQTFDDLSKIVRLWA